MVFLHILLDDKRIRIHTYANLILIRIRESNKHVDPVDPYLYSDPEHWNKVYVKYIGYGISKHFYSFRWTQCLKLIHSPFLRAVTKEKLNITRSTRTPCPPSRPCPPPWPRPPSRPCPASLCSLPVSSSLSVASLPGPSLPVSSSLSKCC